MATSDVEGVGLAAEGSAGSFLGWRMVGVAFAAQFIANGVTLTVIGNFVGPVSAEFGVAPTTIGMAPGLSILIMGIAGPFVGRALDAGQTRKLMTAGVLLTGVGLILASRATSLGQLTAAYLLFAATGAALFGPMPSMALVANWFERQRGFALGLAVAGATIVSWVAPAIAQYFIDHFTWRDAALAFGTFCLVVGVPIFAFLVVARPEHVGQRPDGDDGIGGMLDADPSAPAADEPDAVLDEPELSAGEIARDVRLWLAAVGFGLVLTSPVVLVPTLVYFAQSELGLTGQQATAFFGAMVPFSLAGKVVLGKLADVAPLKPIILLVVVSNVLVWYLLDTSPAYPLFLTTGAIYGIAIGGAAPLQGVLMARLFGRVNFGRASGIGGLAAIPLLAGASLGSQALLSATGSYSTLFMAQIGMLLVGGTMLGIVRIPGARGR